MRRTATAMDLLIDKAIALAYSADEVLRAIDPESSASRRSMERPNPRRIPTVRRTGSEGKPVFREPVDRIDRRRVRDFCDELPELSRCVLVGRALGFADAQIRRSMRLRNLHFDDKMLNSLQDRGRQWVEKRMREEGLLDTAA